MIKRWLTLLLAVMLVFVYAGSAYEIVVTPDNRYFNPCGYELGVEFGFENIYTTFYHKKAVYVP